jgi:hypothetical protein
MLRVPCTTCRAEQVFYIFAECCRTERGSISLDYRLVNRDVVFQGLPSNRLDA